MASKYELEIIKGSSVYKRLYFNNYSKAKKFAISHFNKYPFVYEYQFNKHISVSPSLVKKFINKLHKEGKSSVDRTENFRIGKYHAEINKSSYDEEMRGLIYAINRKDGDPQSFSYDLKTKKVELWY